MSYENYKEKRIPVTPDEILADKVNVSNGFQEYSLRNLIDKKFETCPGYIDGYHMGHAIGQYEAILSVLEVISIDNWVNVAELKEKVKTEAEKLQARDE